MSLDFDKWADGLCDRLRAEITADVVKSLTPLVHAASQQPSLVDRHRQAELLGISVPKLDSLVREGVIPSKQVGTRRLFDPAAVIAAIPDTGGVSDE
ncbi:helix-turn-helix domain-containing protein [Rosistilla oblonga]|uniref:Helix-turn-helix domain protein n=1 Tax=Rosistilla oblonga TaxID=2527990 RepID=A0A518ITR2_9BACT|nr:helix-turn-helix domain-containing protein [Rosistilla oblonga]QDV56475.1 hypothetical protein Mal33_24650 [Rosistilla oblonga]